MLVNHALTLNEILELENQNEVFINTKLKENNNEKQIENFVYKMPLGKRLFDVFLASLALIAISPILLIIAILIKLDSKGPVFYASKRVGTGFKIFDFYKFRSMKVGADKEIDKLKHLNQYEVAETEKNHSECKACSQKGEPCSELLYLDDEVVCENLYNQRKAESKKGSFVKFKNDPRVTKLGQFIRNTSIDELPQLFNILKGDMSIVGNRPLPIYEAEQLTSDNWSLRFLAPAGLTGLWQVSKRGKGEMSEDERKGLDNNYALNYSTWMDLKIILKTVPALFQQENV